MRQINATTEVEKMAELTEKIKALEAEIKAVKEQPTITRDNKK